MDTTTGAAGPSEPTLPAAAALRPPFHESRQPSQAGLAATSRTVRSNWLRYLSEAWHRISRTSKALLLFSVFLVIAQIASTVAVLVVARHETCDKPLHYFLILYVARVGCSVPFLLYQHLSPSNRSFLRRNQDANSQEQPSSQATIISGWVDRIKSLLDLFAVLWFIIGNYLLFTSETCPRAAPTLFYTTLAWVLLGYLLILIPLLLCASVIFCLPCVLVAMRVLQMDMVAGGQKDEIQQIPVYKYKAPEGVPAASPPAPPISSSTTTIKKPTSPSPWKVEFWRRWLRPNEKDPEQALEELTIPKDDATCSICLCEYAHGELCDHHFHRDCVHEWLALNRKCPLCKRDFRGKEYTDEDEEEQSSSQENV
ncbi:hypothetical protein EC973_008727 [Apophysomyces ossiformis]|uniref:RING-type domain-containing protein n=1 Tax=Apophysomyces ossiformis TaxID=679940 RepID=A0A8H7BS55_9FUNG|nr:hypothetical protein EC973_008727 [Apophysomyces ossiformis]